MQEIWIAELLITLFLFLHITRPVIKAFRSIEGLAWLPLAALVICLVLFPAYGFRPELIPLLLYSAILSGTGISGQLKNNAKFDRYRKTWSIVSLAPLVLLAAAAGTAFYFTPQTDTAFQSQGVYTLAAFSGAAETTAGNSGEDESGSERREYFIRIYTDKNDLQPSSRPLILVLPPLPGSLDGADMVSAELRDRGFTVLTCTRRGFDSPAVDVSGEGETVRYGISPAEWYRRFNAFLSGTSSAKANARGQALEEARKEDLQFLLSWIRQNPPLGNGIPLFGIASRDAVFLAGYDAGGSALILLGNSLSLQAAKNDSPAAPFSPGEIRIRGLIAIESPLWSIYRTESPEIPVTPQDAGWLESVGYGFKRWWLELQPRKMAGLGQVPELSLPVLFLISDKGREPAYAGNKYLALQKCFEAARSRAVLASADGAGALDYSDFPVRYPFITAFFRGRQKPVWNNLEAPAGTAGIITSFAVSTLAAGGMESSRLVDSFLPAGIRFSRK